MQDPTARRDGARPGRARRPPNYASTFEKAIIALALNRLSASADRIGLEALGGLYGRIWQR